MFYMKTKLISLLLVFAFTAALSGCGGNSAENPGTSSAIDQTDTYGNTTSNGQTSPTEPTVGTDPTNPKEEGESRTENPASQNAASPGQSGGKPGSSSSAASSTKPSGGGATGGGTAHSAPSSQTPSTTPSSKPESSLPPSKPESSSSSSSKPSGGGSSSTPAVPDYLKPYVYPFDIPAIKADLIAYGESLGMTHYTHHPDGTLRTPDNCSWWDPYPLTINCKDPAQTRRQLREMVEYDRDYFRLVDFTIYTESGPNDQYNIYMMH